MSNRALLLWYKWLFGPGYHPLYEEITFWSFYGRRYLIQQSRHRFWTQENTENPYETQYRELSLQDNPMYGDWIIERSLAKVSLIV
jgi:hypothetical protein